MQSTANGDGPSHWSGRVNQVLLEIINHDLSKAYFNTPPPGSNNSAGTAPICFALILQRIMDRAYSSPAEVHADIQRVWAQCRASCPPGSEPVRAAERLAPMVELLWRHMGLATSRQPGSEASLPPPLAQSPQQAQMQAQMQAQQLQAQMQGQHPGSRPTSRQSFGQDQAAQAQLERADQQGALLAQRQLLLAQRRRAAAAAAAAGMAPQQSPAGFGSEGVSPFEQPAFGSGTFGGAAAVSLAGARSLSQGLGAAGGSQSLELMPRGSSGAFGQEASLLLGQQADLAAQQRVAAQDRARREQRVAALLRMKHDLMAGIQPDQGAAHAALEAQHASTLSLAPLGARSDSALQRQISLAEQQQLMLNAMASGQAPPPQHGELAAGARPPSRQLSLAARLSGEVSLHPYPQQEQHPGDAAAMQEHERQRHQLAQLKRSMLTALQQRQALHSQRQQLLQQQMQMQMQQQQQMQFGNGAGPQHPLQSAGSGLSQQQLAALQRGYSLDQLQLSQPAAQTPVHDDGGSLPSQGGSQLLSPSASVGASGRRQARQRQSSLQKEAASPSVLTGDDASLRQGHPLRRCLAVLERLLQHEDAEPFAEPVDAEGLRLADYRQIIRRPMDLGTIRNRLAPGLSEGWGMIHYKSTDEVLSDVQLVWANCRRYNAAGSPITAMCDRLETAFCRMWEAAGLGSAAAAAARPHVLSPPAPQLSRNEARGKPHQRQPHGRAGAKPSPRGTAAKPGAAQESSAAVKPAGGRKHGHGGSSPGTGPSAKRPRAQGAAPGALSLPSTAPPATAPELLPSEFPLVSPQLADAEVAEETLELERLLAAGGTSPTAVAAEAAAAGGTASPVLLEAPLPGGLGPEGVAEAVAAPGAQLDAAAAGSYKASGKAAATQRDPFAAQWQATGAPGLAAPPASGRSAADVLLHPDREPVHGSLPPPMLPHNSLGQPSFPPLGDEPQQADVQLHAPLGATSGNVPEGPQQEEGVLVAWQRVQAQREAAQQAMAAAEAAAHEVVKARQDLAAVRAAEAASSAGAPSSSQTQAAGLQQRRQQESFSRPAGSGLTSAQPGRPASAAFSQSAVIDRLRAAAAAGRSSSELADMATAARQARYAALLQLGSELFGSRGCGPASSAGGGDGGSSGSTQVLPGSGAGSPGQASGMSPAGHRIGSMVVSPASMAMEVDVKAEPAAMAAAPVIAA